MLGSLSTAGYSRITRERSPVAADGDRLLEMGRNDRMRVRMASTWSFDLLGRLYRCISNKLEHSRSLFSEIMIVRQRKNHCMQLMLKYCRRVSVFSSFHRTYDVGFGFIYASDQQNYIVKVPLDGFEGTLRLPPVMVTLTNRRV